MPQGYRAPRALSEPEFAAIRDRLLDEAPEGLSEQDFHRWIGPRLEQALGEAENLPPAPEGSALGRFASGVGEMLNPVEMAKGVYEAVRHPLDIASGLVGAQVGEFRKATRAPSVSEAIGHGAAGLIPILGPVAANIGEQIGEGDIAGGIGRGAGLVALPSVIRGAQRGAGVISRAAQRGLQNPNPALASAVRENLAAGVPVDLGTATGNRVIRGAQELSDRSLGGLAAGSTKAAQRAEEALAQRGAQLAKRVTPSPTTAEQAGLGVEQAIEGRGGRLQTAANRAYGELRAIEQANPVQVDMRPVKAALQPIYDRLQRSMPLTQRQASPGLNALENILKGGDLSPLSVADADLSAIKTVARGADAPWLRDVSQGVAARAVGELDRAVQQAVHQMGPAAERALATGRAATRAKYATGDVLEGLRRGTGGEAVKIFGRMVARGDAGIEQLREVARVAPQHMPKVGRAFLEDLLSNATVEGGFKRAAGLFKRWDDLGSETKQILFRDPALRGELNNFFLVAKKMAESANPSGSALVGTLAAQGTGLMMAPLATLGTIAGGAGLSKLMHHPTAVRLITEGIQLAPGAPRLTAITNQLSQMSRQLPSVGQAAVGTQQTQQAQQEAAAQRRARLIPLLPRQR